MISEWKKGQKKGAGNARRCCHVLQVGLRVLILNLGRSLEVGLWVTIVAESSPEGSWSGSMVTVKDLEANLPLTATTFLPGPIGLPFESSIPRVRRMATWLHATRAGELWRGSGLLMRWFSFEWGTKEFWFWGQNRGEFDWRVPWGIPEEGLPASLAIWDKQIHMKKT